ncbi:hypothetical protein [Streptomyces sp. NPDC051561]|uniref:hypothetical protein n=1 Tax=Streptomyces sp. NPDC051561 TaxID=3365658 RepID=UPI0037AD8DFF
MNSRTTRAAREQARLDRRTQVDNLLARYARTVPAEAELLRALVDAETAEGDRYRRECGGQQAAVRREQQRVAAAEEAMRQAEEQARAYAEQLGVRTRSLSMWAHEAREAHGEQQRAEAALARVREQLDDVEALTTRLAAYCVAAQNASGAPNWPALPDAIRATVPDATRTAARYRLAWRSARRRALAAESALAAELPYVIAHQALA